MARTTGKSAQNKNRLRLITARQRRKSIKRSQLKIKKGTLEVRRAVSQRARTHPMEAAGVGQPQTPQKLLMESTAIKRFKYWIEKRRLRIWFVEGGVYDYYDVPESTVIELSQAQSKGRYFYYNIRQVWDKPITDFKRIR